MKEEKKSRVAETRVMREKGNLRRNQAKEPISKEGHDCLQPTEGKHRTRK